MRIVCLSHLGYDAGLFQRPQQVMARLAVRGHGVLYVACTGARMWVESWGAAQTTGGPQPQVLTVPWSPVLGALEGLWRSAARSTIAQVRSRMAGEGPIVQWLYHPSAANLWSGQPAALRVYDVMDRFDAFAARGRRLLEHEQKALAAADVIFTGGESLHAMTIEKLGAVQRAQPADPQCLPSGVDLEHFASALQGAGLGARVRGLPKPVLGYAGAVDERIDFVLIAALAEAFPQGSVVLLGPVLRPVTGLPRNVHLAGPCDYEKLPGEIGAFDVALIPFRQTELVRHISPTKTPEYLAAGKPVVSTLIPDVQSAYGDLVPCCAGPDEFIDAVRRILAERPEPSELSQEAAKRARTWDTIVDLMEARIVESLKGR